MQAFSVIGNYVLYLYRVKNLQKNVIKTFFQAIIV